MTRAFRNPIGTICRTGQRCPESGIWESQDRPSTTAPYAVGNVFAPHNGIAVNWKLIQFA